jgi:transcriptional regulator with XRE-family HTH domain
MIAIETGLRFARRMDPKTRQHLAEAVLRLRTARGLGQAQLSHLSGVSVPTISRLENRNTVKLETVQDLAKALNVPMAHLLGPQAVEEQPQLPGWDEFERKVRELLPAAPTPEFLDRLRFAYDCARREHEGP